MTAPQEFPPILREVMLRPRWLGMLGLCLVVAAVFAWLGQWQLGRAIDHDPLPDGVTETARPLDEVLKPGEYLPEPLVGQKVETTGSWVPEDFIVIAGRVNDGAEGYWVTGQLRVDERTSIAVAIGWAESEDEANAAARSLEAAGPATATITGRVVSDEGPVEPPHSDPDYVDRMSPAVLLGRWHDTEQLDVYRPFLASDTAPDGLADIDSPAPDAGSPVNWLNIFYAIEWAVFAGFAFYIWYRLARDAWELEVEEFEKASSEN